MAPRLPFAPSDVDPVDPTVLVDDILTDADVASVDSLPSVTFLDVDNDAISHDLVTTTTSTNPVRSRNRHRHSQGGALRENVKIAKQDVEVAAGDDDILRKAGHPLLYQPHQVTNQAVIEIPLVLITPVSAGTAINSTHRDVDDDADDDIDGDNEEYDDNDGAPTSESMQSARRQHYLPRLALAQQARVSLHCFVPPSHPEGTWSARVQASSAVNQSLGTTTGSTDITYKLATHIQLLGGCQFSTASARLVHAQATNLPSTPMPSTSSSLPPPAWQWRSGVRWTDPQSKSCSTLLLLPQQAQRQNDNSWYQLPAASFSSYEAVDPWGLFYYVQFHPMTRNLNFLVSAVSMTTHRVRAGFGWSTTSIAQWVQQHRSVNGSGASDAESHSSSRTLFQQLPLSMLELSVDPQLSDRRRAHFSWSCRASGIWNVTAVLAVSSPPSKQQSMTTHRTLWQVCVRQVSTKGWSWILSWQRGDMTIRVPILLGTTASFLPLGEKDFLVDWMTQVTTPLLLLAISSWVQELFTNLLTARSSGRAGQDLSVRQQQRRLETRNKAREDALAQRVLMERQARVRVQAEQEKDNGLIIESAMYQVEGGDSWDVTIPCQFWVHAATSTLTLPTSSKQHLLGFYNVATAATKPDLKLSSEVGSATTKCPWWKEYWTPTNQRRSPPGDNIKSSSEECRLTHSTLEVVPVPTLTVRYIHGGYTYEVCIRDEEALRLPNPDAQLVSS